MDTPKHTTTKSPRFIAFLLGQAFGAANDNAIKVTMIVFVFSTIQKAEHIFYTSVITALLPIAFLMFSPFAGYLSDRYSKNKVLLFSKAPEILAMLIACFALYFESLPLLLVCFFLMSTQSAFFGPAKYGILPEAFRKEDLSMANGIVNMTTNVAILLGSLLGSILCIKFEGHLLWAGIIYLGLALLGTLCISFSPKVHPGNKNAPFDWNVISYLMRDYPIVAKNRTLMSTIWGITYFYALGALFLAIIPVYGKEALGLDDAVAPMMLAALTIGIAVGSLLVGHISKGFIETGWVPLGCLGLGVFSLDLAFFGHTGMRTFLNFTVRSLFDLFMLGISCGFFIVPLYTQLQNKSPENEKGRYIAFSNIISFAGILFASLLAIVLSEIFHMNAVKIIISVGIVTTIMSVIIAFTIPGMILRICIREVLGTLYKIRTINPQNQTKKGVILSNHVSFMDPFMIGATFEKMLSYMMFRSYYEIPLTGWIWRKLHCIPVSGGDSPEKKKEALDIAHFQIESGHAVCLFPEGKLWRTGNLLPFKGGFERITEGIDCEVVPTYIDGMWGSIFSYERGKHIFKIPKKFSDSINIIYGKALPSSVKAFEVRQKIQELSAEAYKHRLKNPLPLHIEFIKVAKSNYSKIFMKYAEGKTLTFGDVLNTALSFSEKLEPGSRVGILLSNKDAIIATLAVLFKGAIPVNLENDDKLSEKLKTLGINKVITNDNAINEVENISWKVTTNISTSFKSAKKIISKFLAGNTTECDEELTVYFTDDNKAISISHRNVYSNIRSFHQTFELKEDTFLMKEHISKPFSFVANFWLASMYGQTIIFPENNEVFDEVTILFTDDVQNTASLFSKNHKIRYFGVVSNALDKNLIQKYKDSHNINLMQLFSLPNCGPFITLNRPDFIDEANYNTQLSTREDSVGLPFPEVALRIVASDTDKCLGKEKEGVILVKGANVSNKGVNCDLSGYFIDGWFITNYRGKLDDKGFLYLV